MTETIHMLHYISGERVLCAAKVFSNDVVWRVSLCLRKVGPYETHLVQNLPEIFSATVLARAEVYNSSKDILWRCLCVINDINKSYPFKNKSKAVFEPFDPSSMTNMDIVNTICNNNTYDSKSMLVE